MNDISQIRLTKQDLDRLQRLRASVMAFQNTIAPMPANQHNDNYGEQFNLLRLEAQTILKIPDFERYVDEAVTRLDLQDGRQALLPRLYIVVMLGVMFALSGLGFNYIIQNDFYLNSLGCLISSGGMFLVMGAFAILSLSGSSRRLSNLGDVYQRCDALLAQINHTLNMAIPSFAQQLPESQLAEVPAVADLALESLNRQMAYWQEKYQPLRQEKVRLEPDVPQELTLTVDFIEREMYRVRHEIARLYSEVRENTAIDASPIDTPTDSVSDVQEIALPDGRKIAVAKVDESLDPSPERASTSTAANEPPQQKSDTREFKLGFGPPPPPETDSPPPRPMVSETPPDWKIEEKSIETDTATVVEAVDISEPVVVEIDNDYQTNPPMPIDPENDHTHKINHVHKTAEATQTLESADTGVMMPLTPPPSEPNSAPNQAMTVAMPASTLDSAPPNGDNHPSDSDDEKPSPPLVDSTLPMSPETSSEELAQDDDEKASPFSNFLGKISRKG